ncbi:MAG: DUF2259 domain-containing protein [Brucellaceae bacterium]|nr:DUF2259 domain-containing protein [Brucellaceae bacterium]
MKKFSLEIGIVAIGLAVSPAIAGDTAELNILGFSGDSSIFAFEEYGVQDGSGFPYANRFYIDVENDAFLSGTPVRIRIDDESATLAEALQQAAAQGEEIVSDDELAANRGYTAGFNAITELSADPYRLAVNPRPVLPPVDTPVEFRLEEFPLPAEGCEDLGETMGYRLLRIDVTDGGGVTLLHEDETIPTSRNCPLGYRLGAVQTVFGDQGQPSFAVLIAVRSFGFEGPDHHWIAVTGRF